MRIRPVYLASLLLAGACQRPATVYDTQKVVGTYTGNYGNKGLLTLVINYINGDVVSGYDTHQGMHRNLNGSITRQGKYLSLVLKEPGDNASDGTFSFTIDTAHRHLEGAWTPLNKGKEQSFTLKPVAGNLDFDVWCTEWGTDTVLRFGKDGVCTYEFYKNSQDSTSQLRTVSGNFVSRGNAYIIEWQKNPYTPVQRMTLLLVRRPGGDSGDSLSYLEGNGWRLTQLND